MLDLAKTVFGMLKGKPLIRKNRVIKIMACVIIIFTLFCSYWDVLKVIGIPIPPRFPEGMRFFLKERLYPYFFIWLFLESLLSALFTRLVVALFADNQQESNIRRDFNFLMSIVDFAFSCYVLLYSIMYLLEYSNGVPLGNSIIVYAAVIYLLFCFFEKTYDEYKILWDKWHRQNTGFIDDNGDETYVGAKVAYNRKKYKVIIGLGERGRHQCGTLSVNLV